MAWNYTYTIIGAIILVSRAYILEVKYREELKPRNRYLSRMLAYIYAIALMVNFQVPSLNFIILYAYGLEIYIIFKQDKLFFQRYLDNKPLNNDEPRNLWILYERITLHIPLVLTCTIWIATMMPPFYNDQQLPPPLWHAFLGIGIGLVIFFLFDARNPFGQNLSAPYGKNILKIMFLSCAIMITCIYWITPLVIF